MAKDSKVRMPSSTAGITTYYEQSTSRFTMGPGTVVVMCAFVLAVIILLHVFVDSLLGVA